MMNFDDVTKENTEDIIQSGHKFLITHSEF